MIQLNNLSFHYEKTILEHVDLTIKKGKITFILGLNGSGKSTLAYILSGLVFPKSGTLFIDDLKINKHTENKEIRKKVGIVFQNPNNQFLFPKVLDDIQFTLENIGISKEQILPRILESLSIVGMQDYLYANPSELSEGQKQKVAIASQISLQPDYLIFDEVTSMLDVKGKKEIYKLLQKLKKKMGIIFITNHMEELIYADEVIIIEHGKVIKYSINEIIKDNEILSKHDLEVPFLFKLASLLKIDDISKMNEKDILDGILKL